MNIQQLQVQHHEAQLEASNMRARLQQTAMTEGRPLGEGEISSINTAVAHANAIKRRLDAARSNESMTAALDVLVADGGLRRSSGLGGQFVASDVFKWLCETKNTRAGVWNSPLAELPITLHATTLDESSGSGGALVIPDYQPGIVPLPTRRLVMSDLIAPGTTNSNTVTYMRETTFTNAAAAVAEGAAKPESTLVFDAVSEPVRKIAHWLPVSEEMLDDPAGLESYLDARLRTGVQLKEDSSLLNGAGAPDLVGFLNRSGLATSIARGTDVNADAILKQVAAISSATNLMPDGIVMHPSNWLTVQLLKTTDGLYVSGRSPFTAQQPQTLWGIPVALTSAIAVNTALVGCFKTASQLFRRGGMRVEATNSHQDFFVKNLVAIRAEERLALAVYRPSAFGTVTGLN